MGKNGHDIWLDGKKLSHKKSCRLRNHSPSGFSWGYLGSGPAQLALAILLELKGKEFALKNYQHFKEDFIAEIPHDIDEFIIKFELPDAAN